MNFQNFKKGDSQTRTKKRPAYGDRRGIYSEGTGVKVSQDAAPVGFLTNNSKDLGKDIENGEEGRAVKEVNVGSEKGDGILQLEGSIIEYSEISDKCLDVNPTKGDLVTQRDNLGDVGDCNKDSSEVPMEGMEGSVDVSDENVEGMSLSLGILSACKWIRVARKKNGAKGLVGVYSPIKRILNAHKIIKKKSRDGSPSSFGIGQSIGESFVSPSTSKQEEGAKRKLATPPWNDEINEKKKKQRLIQVNLMTLEAVEPEGHIDAKVKMESGLGWHFTSFYRNLNQSIRSFSWELLKRIKRVDNLPWVCGGDFNEITSVEEKMGGSNKQVLGMVNFILVINDCNLIDLSFSRPKLTWNNKRDGVNNIQERLDRFLANKDWMNLFLYAGVKHLGYNNSDHMSILLNLRALDRGVMHKSELSFKFEHFWLMEEDCGKVVCLAWKESGESNLAEDLHMKMGGCAMKLGEWSRERFVSLRKLINSKREALEGLLGRASDEGVSKEIGNVESELECLLSKDEVYWKQRALTDWLALGDQNSKFFHRKASAGKKQN
ncbi:hypothetical protein QYF36_003358 [Acer negundo]|nr:hypothetical protein QYF36_003358 [Acer negundo]